MTITIEWMNIGISVYVNGLRVRNRKLKEWPQLKQPFTNQIMDEVLRNMTDDELEALSAAKPE